MLHQCCELYITQLMRFMVDGVYGVTGPYVRQLVVYTVHRIGQGHATIQRHQQEETIVLVTHQSSEIVQKIRVQV